MPRNCGCSSASCSCLVVSSDGSITVEGSGSALNPYDLSAGSISLAGRLQVQDTDTVNLTLNGQGSLGDPFILSAVAALSLGELEDVDASNMTVGYVPARLADGTFAMAPPSTAPVGAITTDASLDGDGSGGDPLSVHDYANIAWLEAAEDDPNLQNFNVGSLTDDTAYAMRVQREAPVGYSHTNAAFEHRLYAAGAAVGLVGYLSLHWDGVEVAALRLDNQGRILTGTSPGTSHPFPYRQFSEEIIVTMNGTSGFTDVSFPASRFTDEPVVIGNYRSISSGALTVPIVIMVSNLSTTGARINLVRADGGTLLGSYRVGYHAIQMEP